MLGAIMVVRDQLVKESARKPLTDAQRPAGFYRALRYIKRYGDDLRRYGRFARGASLVFSSY
jgi:hypothetical protein